MTGFKSYGPKEIRVPLARGFTVIAGPNGSGKSNIVDAISFALGMMSKKSMRAGKMTDLIYNGVGGRKPADKTIVEIVFDNSDHAIPVPEEEVIISRELRRDGTGVYRFNGKRSTRQEIMDKLRLASIDPQGFNIIQQGQINEIILMSPLQRRELLEEVAGVRNFDQKKQAALKELEQAEQKMGELQVLVREVAARVESLQKEKEKAEKWERLNEEIRVLRSQLISARFHEANAEVEQFDVQINELLEKQAQLEASLSESVDVQLEELKEQLQVIERELNGIAREIETKQRELQKTELEETRLREQVNADTRSIEEYKVQITRLEQQISELKASMEEERNEEEELIAQEDDLVVQLDEMQEERQVLQQQLEEQQEKANKVKEEQAFVNDEYMGLQTQITTITVRLASIEGRMKALQRNIEARQQKIAEKEQYIRQIENTIQQTLEKLEGARENVSSLTQERDDLQEQVSSLEAKIQQRTSEIKDLKDQLLIIKTQQKTIESFKSSQARQKKGTKNPANDYLLNQAKERAITGIVGTLEQIAQTIGGVPTTLENLSQALIVESTEVALQCITLLKEAAIGATYFIPLDKFGLTATVDPHTLVATLSTNSIIVENLDQAAQEWNKSTTRMITTIDGDVFYPHGVVFGGFHLASAESTLISLKEQEEELETKIQEVNEHLNTLKDELDTKKKRLSNVTRHISELEHLIARTEAQIEQEKKNLERQKTELEQFLVEEDLSGQLEELKQQKTELESQIEMYQQEKAELEDKLNELDQILEELDTKPLYEKITIKEKELRQIEGQIGIIRTKIESLQKSRREKASRIEEYKQTIIEAEQEIARLEGSLDAKKERIRELEEQKITIEEEISHLQDQKEDISEKQRRLRKEVQQHEHQRNEVLKKIEELKDQINELRIQKERAATKREQAIADSQEYGVEILPRNQLPEKINIKKLTGQIEAKQIEIKKLGAINQKAIEEFEDEFKRYEDMVEKRDLLAEERQIILDFINQIETEKYRIFMKTFKSIATEFSKIFAELSGGNGRLYLENPDDPFSGGVIIEANPGGKKVASLESMSGGEKALTALAFIFAVQTVDAQPFYVLDEVDAALDNMNVSRVARLIKRLSKLVGKENNGQKGAQFIVISHREQMMREAERIYGVTNVNGLSTMIIMDMEDVFGKDGTSDNNINSSSPSADHGEEN